MKLNLTTSIDCRHRFRKSDGKLYMFPGQDFRTSGSPTDNEKCRGIYTGPDIEDRLDCDTGGGGGGGSYSDTSSGRSPESPPPEESSIVIPPPDCICDIRAAFGGLDGLHYYLEVKNWGTCDLYFNATCTNELIIIEPNFEIHLPPGATVTLQLNSSDESYQQGDVLITTNVGCSYTISVGTIPPEPTEDELDTNL